MIRRRIEKQKGAALLVILAVFSIIIPTVQGVWMDSQLEYQFRRYRINELQARENAESGISFGLLRLYIFKGVEKSVSGQMDSILRPLLDQVWSFPFAWPLPISDELLESDKQTLRRLKEESFMRGSYGLSMTPEGGFLDVNDLSSSFEPLRKFTFDSLFRLLILLREENEEIREKYENSDFVTLLNNLSDWTDLDNESRNGGSEELVEEGKQPLNRSFTSIDEMKKTPGMNQDLFELLSPYITAYGSKSLNINYAKPELLRAVLDIPPDLADQIVSRTQIQSEYYEPFLDEKAFCNFMNQLNTSTCEDFSASYGSLDLLRFNYPMAFRIKSSGEYRGQIVNLEALFYDLSSSALNWQKLLYRESQRQKERDREGLQPEESDKEGKEGPAKALKEPKIDYSYYKSLIIMYLREDS